MTLPSGPLASLTSHQDYTFFCIAPQGSGDSPIGSDPWAYHKDQTGIIGQVYAFGEWLLLQSGYFYRVATSTEWLLLQSGYFYRVATSTEWLLLQSGYFYR